MPVNLTAPGVYVEEIPRGSRSIAGVSTSNTAFIGRARRGPVDTATLVTSFGEYERVYGGLWALSDLGHVVRQFFSNGGRRAYIVRVQTGAQASEGSVPGPSLILSATAAVTALPNFDHLRVVVTHGQAANAYTLVISAEDQADAVLNDGAQPQPANYAISVDLTTDAADPAAVLASAQTATQPPIALATLVGSAPALRPAATTAPHIVSDGGPVMVPVPDAFTFSAADPGTWGDGISVTVTPDPGGTTFALTERLTDRAGREVESRTYNNLSLDTAATNYVGAVLQDRSSLLRLTAAPSALASAEASGMLSGGDDGSQPAIGAYRGSEANRTGLFALDDVDVVNLLCVPFPASAVPADITARAGFWSGTAFPWLKKRGAMAIVDPPGSWTNFDTLTTDLGQSSGWLSGLRSPYAAQFFPNILAPDPLQENRLRPFPPCGAVAGVIARIDAGRGVWKASAGTEATLAGVLDLEVALTDAQQGVLNKEGINCARNFRGYGPVLWGARTLFGEDRRASEWKYLPVRRLTSFLQQSLLRGTQWAVFEGNDEALWSQLRLNIEGFLHRLFRQGAFAGASPQDAYFVKCDSATTTQADIDAGVVNVRIGFAPVRPAEFVVIRIQQIARQ